MQAGLRLCCLHENSVNILYMRLKRITCFKLFLNVLNIDFPLILISLNVVERSLLLEMNLVIVGANGKMLNLMP